MLVRLAILVAVAVVLVVMLVGCARYDGDQAAFCAQLRRAPSFMELSAQANRGDEAQAAASMRSAAAQFRSMERVAPRKIRHTVSALGDAAERIAANLEPHTAKTQVVVVQQDDGTVRRIRVPSSQSQRRLEVFYTEMQNHHGTISAMYALTTYARDRCGFTDRLLDLGMAGYGPSALDGPDVSVPAQIHGPEVIVPPTTAPG